VSKHIFFLLTFCISSIAIASECPDGHYPVRSHHRNAYVKSDGTEVSPTRVKESCHPYRKSQAPTPIFTTTTPKQWPNPKDKFRAWTKTEEAKIRAVLSQLPLSLTHIGEIRFLRSVGSSDSPAYSNSFNQVIVITDEIKSYDLKRVVAHELAHFFWDSLEDKRRDEYYLAADWKKSADGLTASLVRKDVQIPDSYISPHEDFTNSVELLVHDKSLLKASPLLLRCLENFIQ
jgi:hypothetical protein